ncbi:hypothetical protein R3Q16_32265 [Rhodococcus globerulus]|uniref:Uncharacterized protein n=1 Tax=Rhodococcus globerulus TaxID=33008 RepID=A0ABU4C4K0_RHOGO|nr:hypothetical protein [Rhodococcus globerulus]
MFVVLGFVVKGLLGLDDYRDCPVRRDAASLAQDLLNGSLCVPSANRRGGRRRYLRRDLGRPRYSKVVVDEDPDTPPRALTPS